MRLLALILLFFNSLPANAQFRIEPPEGKAWAGKDPIKGVRVFQQVYNIDTSGQRFLFDSSVTEVFAAGNIFLHDLSYRFSRVLQDIELVAEERHHYFIYAKDSTYGYDWDGHRDPVILRLPVDSVLNRKEHVSGPTAIDQLFELSNASLLNSRISIDSGTATETFALKAKSDPSSSSITCTINYAKQPQLIAVGLLQSPANRQGFSISNVQVIAESYPCRFDIRYTLQSLPSIKPNIASIFETYRANETANLIHFPSGSTTTIGSWQ